MGNDKKSGMPDVLTVAEFLEWSRIGRGTFYKEVQKGNIPIRKVGKKTLIRRCDAEEWLNKLPVNELWRGADRRT